MSESALESSSSVWASDGVEKTMNVKIANIRTTKPQAHTLPAMREGAMEMPQKDQELQALDGLFVGQTSLNGAQVPKL